MEPSLISPINPDTIAAISTPPGIGGIAVIRISGPEAINVVSKIWKGRNLEKMAPNSVAFGKILADDGQPLDEVLISLFRNPASFTGEDTVEISCHGSNWIQREILHRLVDAGARPAEPGEFTRRAFLNGKIDLAQAEGIADLISASSRNAHRQAMLQTSGVFSARLDSLRQRLIEFASLLELEIDFSEEEVEFADRRKLVDLCMEILHEVGRLADSYSRGKAFKEGIPVVIAGQPNAGKSTLLNLLLQDDKAIVSNIPGTTRDIIEDTVEIQGTLYRFIDTAGLRSTDDTIEQLGIDRAIQRLKRAAVVIWLIDLSAPLSPQIDLIREQSSHLSSEHSPIFLLNKTDLVSPDTLTIARQTIAESLINPSIRDNHTPDIIPSCADSIIPFCADSGQGEQELINRLTAVTASGRESESQILITNARHYAALTAARTLLERIPDQLENGLSADFIAQDLREVLHHLGQITGSITTPDLLASIFTRFCIGK